jgi:hypothetical protein
MAPRRLEIAMGAAVAIGLCTAPTVGDIGGCGVRATSLDMATFADERKQVDCQRCTECGLATMTCRNACDPNAPSDVAWPATCHPLLHDGDVCIRALQAASCGAYASFVDDVAPTEPSECDFCHQELDAGLVGIGEL